MLSAETAIGKYPIEALNMMDRIIRYTELTKGTGPSYIRGNTFAEATADASCRAAEDIGAKVLVAFTQSGFTARLLSKFRPRVPIIAYTPDDKIKSRMCLYWGVTPMIMKPPSNIDELISEVERSLIKERIAKRGDGIVITASSPFSTLVKTNFMKLHRIGE
jgi:pyruvate kinase